MSEYSRPLGDAVKRARGKAGLTQNEVADAADIDVRTVLNIENYKGNPKMEVLYPLVRTLKIDAREIFNPEMRRETPSLRQLRLLMGVSQILCKHRRAVKNRAKIICWGGGLSATP